MGRLHPLLGLTVVLSVFAPSDSCRVSAEPPPHSKSSASSASIEWVPIPGGTFGMGSWHESPREKPVHRVTVSPFKMARTETTVTQYGECIQAGQCTDASEGQCSSGEESVPVQRGQI